jgi:hypothetical protein
LVLFFKKERLSSSWRLVNCPERFWQLSTREQRRKNAQAQWLIAIQMNQ